MITIFINDDTNSDNNDDDNNNNNNNDNNNNNNSIIIIIIIIIIMIHWTCDLSIDLPKACSDVLEISTCDIIYVQIIQKS